MINDPNMINKLLSDFNNIPDEIIKEAIVEVIQEDEKQNIIQSELKIENKEKYSIKEGYYYFNDTNEYVHKINRTSYNLIERILKRHNDKDEELGVA